MSNQSIINGQNVNIDQLLAPTVLSPSSSPSLQPYASSVAWAASDPHSLYVGDDTVWTRISGTGSTGPQGVTGPTGCTGAGPTGATGAAGSVLTYTQVGYGDISNALTGSYDLSYTGATQSLIASNMKVGATGIYFTNATASYLPGQLTYYEQDTPITFVAQLDLGSGPTGAFVCTFTRLGNLVTMSYPQLQIAVGSNTGAQIATTTDIPVRFRPTTAPAWVAATIDGSTNVTINTGNLIIVSGGAINITGDNNGFFNNAWCGITPGFVSWSL